MRGEEERNSGEGELTLSLYEDAEQGVCGGHGLAEVVVVVDRQQVAVDVGVANHHLHVGDAVDVHDELEELLKLARFEAVHGKAPELSPILQEGGGGDVGGSKKKKVSRTVSVMTETGTRHWGLWSQSFWNLPVLGQTYTGTFR